MSKLVRRSVAGLLVLAMFGIFLYKLLVQTKDLDAVFGGIFVMLLAYWFTCVVVDWLDKKRSKK